MGEGKSNVLKCLLVEVVWCMEKSKVREIGISCNPPVTSKLQHLLRQPRGNLNF